MGLAELRSGVEDSAIEIFGRDLPYTPLGGSQITARGFFSSAYNAADFDGGAMEENEPRVVARRTDIVDPKQGDLWSIDGQTYVVTEVRLDEGGLVTMILRET